jgi:hypothetical protein
MEHTKFSYAKRTKIFGMILFIVLSFFIMLSLNLINASPTYCTSLATGGIITSYENRCVHTFLINGSFNITETLTAEVLVVAGGGAGGAGATNFGGGGGAGGLVYNSSMILTAGNNYTATIGLGGLGTAAMGNNGTNSTFNNMIAIGGGGGALAGGGRAQDGGSGGGSGHIIYGGGPGISIQITNSNGLSYGFAGGTGANGGAGGGGAGGGGVNDSSANNGTKGGLGRGYTINGTNVTYACGGGGGGVTGGLGGCSSGGKGTNYGTSDGTNGTDGTGGGGGAGTATLGQRGGNGVVIISYVAPITISLNLPLNNSLISSIMNYNFTIRPYGKTIKNYTVYVWYPNNTIANQTLVSGLSNTNNLTVINNISLENGEGYLWNVYACVDSKCYWALNNITFGIYVNSPSIIINSGNGTFNYGSIYVNHTVTYFINDTHLDSCWMNYNSINRTISCINATVNTVNFTLQPNDYNASIYINDTYGNEKRTYFIWDYNIFENSRTYNTLTYETASESFSTNITAANSSLLTAVNLIWNGTSHAAINNLGTWNSTFDIPIQAATATKTFLWNFVYNGVSINSINNNTQTVYPITFAKCSDTNNITYLNFTYEDEMQYFPINASVPLANFNYWLGSGSIQKSYPFINNTNTLSTGFCFSPSNRSITANYIYKASSTDYPGYPIRIFNSILNLSLTNVSTNKILYLLSSTDGATMIVQVIDIGSGNAVENARVTVTRDIGGTLIAVIDGYTDATGSLSVFLSSVVPYTITVSKSGCGSNSKTITPVGSIQMSLNCAGNITTFSSSIDGVTYQHTPEVGISYHPGNIVFAYYVASAFHPITAARFELWDNEGTMLASNTSLAGYPNCNTTSCLMTIKYYTASGDNIKGRYYVNLGNYSNGTYILLEKDAYWRYIFINSNNSQQAWMKTTMNFQEFMNIWTGGKLQNCAIYYNVTQCNVNPSCRWQNATNVFGNDASRCILKDDINKMEFNRMLIIFFAMVIVLFIMGRGIGYEMTNPGSFVAFMAVIIIILSIGGMFTFSGLTPWEWFNQYIYAYICLMFALGYNLSIMRRYSA